MKEDKKESQENDLQRFIDKHEEYYEMALYEIKHGEKKSCWIWYIFPQIRGLGKSVTSNYYGIKNIEEGIEYLKNEKLKHNLIEITEALLNLGDVNITKVMGFIDDIKLKSSMTLFNEVEQKSGIDCGKIFQRVLQQFFKNEKDENTLKILEQQEKQKNEGVNKEEIINEINKVENINSKIETNKEEVELNNNSNENGKIDDDKNNVKLINYRKNEEIDDIHNSQRNILDKKEKKENIKDENLNLKKETSKNYYEINQMEENNKKNNGINKKNKKKKSHKIKIERGDIKANKCWQDFCNIL